MIREGKCGDRVERLDFGKEVVGADYLTPCGIWDSDQGTTGTILEKWVANPTSGHRRVFYEVVPDFPNYGRFTVRGKDLRRIE